MNDFDYEKTFMAVSVDNRLQSAQEIYNGDYRIRKLKEMTILKKGKILDIGCGGGVLTEALPYYFPKTAIYGCDISKTAILLARKRNKSKIHYDVIKKNKLPYVDNFFDLCTVFDVIEHVPDPQQFLSEIRRVLKPRGLFFLVVPCEGQPWTLTWF